MPVQYSYTSTPPMDRTAFTEPQCLYSTAITLFPLRTVQPVRSLSSCTNVTFTLPFIRVPRCLAQCVTRHYTCYPHLIVAVCERTWRRHHWLRELCKLKLSLANNHTYGVFPFKRRRLFALKAPRSAQSTASRGANVACFERKIQLS